MPSPRLSIGLPVFNGERFLAQALASILNQTYADFELVISDNASTDGTEELCRDHAAKDQRIRYCRNATNIGATQNWYRVFDLSSGEYFASVAHDDVYAPRYMDTCISELDKDASVVVCYSKTHIIDVDGHRRMQGRYVPDLDIAIDTMSQHPCVRLYNVITRNLWCLQLYGVMRAAALRRTTVFAGYYSADRNTLAELALWGKIYQYPEAMFYYRIYDASLGQAPYRRKTATEMRLWDPGTNWSFRHWKLKVFLNYFHSVSRVPMPGREKLRCYAQLLRIILGKAARRVRMA
jgi:glycosyltransferase involved in cell wall biosynthesis